MIGDWLGELALVLMQGPILLLMLLVYSLILGGICWYAGKRRMLREIDESRGRVRRAQEKAVAERITLPGQRSGER